MGEETLMLPKAAIDYWSKDGHFRKSRLPELKRLRGLVEDEVDLADIASINDYLESLGLPWHSKTDRSFMDYLSELEEAAENVPGIEMGLVEADILRIRLLDDKGRELAHYNLILPAAHAMIAGLLENRDDILHDQIVISVRAIDLKSGIKDYKMVHASCPESFWEEVDAFSTDNGRQILERIQQLSKAFENVKPLDQLDSDLLPVDEDADIKEAVDDWLGEDGCIRKERAQELMDRLAKGNVELNEVPPELAAKMEKAGGLLYKSASSKGLELGKAPGILPGAQKKTPMASGANDR